MHARQNLAKLMEFGPTEKFQLCYVPQIESTWPYLSIKQLCNTCPKLGDYMSAYLKCCDHDGVSQSAVGFNS